MPKRNRKPAKPPQPKVQPPVFDPPRMRLEFDPQGDAKRPWVTACVHTFRSGPIEFQVPAGFRTDLASVPRCLLWLHDPLGLHQRAALFHDGAYELQPCSRLEADLIFAAALEVDQVPAWRRASLFWAVRLLGWWRWEKARETVQLTRDNWQRTCHIQTINSDDRGLA